MNKIFAPFLPPWVETGLQPAFYDMESGTVLQQTARMYAKVQQLTRLFNELSEETKATVEETKATVEEYIAKFVELKDYVDDYFDNLDVQEEINNKLDQMAEDGTLEEIVENYLGSNFKIYVPQLAATGDLSIVELNSNGEQKIAIIDFGSYSESIYEALTAKLIAKGYTKFDYAFVSHYHNDHVGNLLHLLDDDRFDFSDCIFYLPTTPDYTSFIGSTRYVPNNELDIKNALTTKGITYHNPSDDETLTVLEKFNIKFYNSDLDDFTDYYAITEEKEGIQVTNYNNFSMVMEIEVEGKRALFTGDIEEAAEKTVATQIKNTPDVLKIEHHALTYKVDSDYRYIVSNAKVNYIIGNSATIEEYPASEKGNLLYTRDSGDISIFVGNTGITADSEYGEIKSGDKYLWLGTNGAYIASGDDLDDYTKSGSFSTYNSAITNSLSNCPITGNSFRLIVLAKNNVNRLAQFLYVNTADIVYSRQYNNGTWSAWRIINNGGDNETIANGTDLNSIGYGCYQSASATSATLVNLPTELRNGRVKITTGNFNNASSSYQIVESNIQDPNSVDYPVIYYRMKAYSSHDWSEWIRISQMPILLGNNADLNNFNKEGKYYSDSGTMTGTITNTPTGMRQVAFCLQVTKLSQVADRFLQEITILSSSMEVYKRVKTNEGWSNWFTVGLTKITS